MEEVYCSFKIAKLLNENGFDEPLFEFYSNTGKILYSRHSKGLKISELDNELCNYYPHITHQMAMGWLRQKGIDCIIDISNITARPRKYYAIIWDNDNKSYIIDLFDSYKEAVEAALKYCLENLI